MVALPYPTDDPAYGYLTADMTVGAHEITPIGGLLEDTISGVEWKAPESAAERISGAAGGAIGATGATGVGTGVGTGVTGGDTDDDGFMSTWVPGGTEAMDPYEQYRRMVYGQMPSMPYGTRASQALERAAMSRFAPSLGQFLLSAYPSGLPGTEEEAMQTPTFTEWAQRQPATAATGARMPFAGAAGTPAYQTFQNIADLSRMYGTDPTPAQQAEMAGSPYGGFLTGDPQSYITQYALGGPQRGYLGRLMGNRAGRLQDLFEKQRMTQGSDIYGAPEEQYFDWLRNVLPAQYGIGATGS
jgi:hypothetical protein